MERKVDVGSRDGEGFTARDYLEAMQTDLAVDLMQIIDEHVIHKVCSPCVIMF